MPAGFFCSPGTSRETSVNFCGNSHDKKEMVHSRGWITKNTNTVTILKCSLRGEQRAVKTCHPNGREQLIQRHQCRNLMPLRICQFIWEKQVKMTAAFWIALSQLWLRTCIIKWVSCHKIFISPPLPNMAISKMKNAKRNFFLISPRYMNLSRLCRHFDPEQVAFRMTSTLLSLQEAGPTFQTRTSGNTDVPASSCLKPKYPPITSPTTCSQVRTYFRWGAGEPEPGEAFENFKAALEFKVRFSRPTLAIFSKVGVCVKPPDVGISGLAHRNCNIAQK